MRLSYEELNKIKEQYGVNELWSFSKFDTYRTSHYEFLLKYVLHEKELSEKESAYAPMGSSCHDALEKFYNGEVKYEELSEMFDDAWMMNIDIANLYFDRGDTTKNNNMKDKYYANLKHYFEHFTPIEGKTVMEQFLTIKVNDDIVFQGYADCMVQNKETGTIDIIDFKTSSLYSGSIEKGGALKDHAAQLTLYAEALRQKGVPQDKIRAGFSFLKYVSVDCEQVNGKIKTRQIERNKIGESLQASAKTWLKKLGHEDEMMEYLDTLAQSNDVTTLPEDVQAKFKVYDCYVWLDNIWDFYEELKVEIIETIAEIRSKVAAYETTKDDNLFWDSDESLKAQSYYYNNLCGYSLKQLRPYQQYLDKLKAEKEDGLLGVPKSNDDSYDEFDMSWLNSL